MKSTACSVYCVVSCAWSSGVDVGIDDLVVLEISGSGGNRRFRSAAAASELRQVRMVRPHVVRIRQAEVLVEAVLQRQKLLVMAQVPLAEDRRGVAAAAAELGQRDFLGVDAVLRTGVECAEDADAFRIAAGHQARRATRSRRPSRSGNR